MDYAKEERIGNPDLFTGRKKELAYFLTWINDVKERKSKSTAILARRKLGKTALLERLFNITFYNNNGVIPFYFEIEETKVWVVDFCQNFFLTFIYQYIAFKSRKPEYLKPEIRSNFDGAVQIAKKEGLDYLCPMIEDVAHAVKNKKIDTLWTIVREAPQTIAFRQKEFIVQLIDEFQFFNAMICRDKNLKNVATTLAGSYLGTAESKIAPLLVSGSWVGWLTNLLREMLPSRFKTKTLYTMPQDESIEMVYKYSQFFEVPVTEETVYLIATMAEGSPFYISSIMRSECEDKDLTTLEGVTKTLEFETLDKHGEIKATWMEYIASALPRINERNGKNIVLYLCKNRDREVTRQELLENLKLDMTDAKLEEKLNALVKSDIVAQGESNFRYQGVKDNIFDKVFRGVYEEEIQKFDVRNITREFHEELEKIKTQYNQLSGKYNFIKGNYAEYSLYDQLHFHAQQNNESLKSITRYLPADFNFCQYATVWRYNYAPLHGKNFNVDILARATQPENYSIIGEVKNRDSKKFSKEEAEEFLVKYEEVKHIEKLERTIAFIFSLSGFTQEAEEFCQEKGIACSDNDRWLVKIVT